MHSISRILLLSPVCAKTREESQPFKEIDERAREWHKKLLDKKNRLESARRKKLLHMSKELDKIAKDEIENLRKAPETGNSSINFEIPVINMEDDIDVQE
jgi:hypothetical protein